MATKPREYSTDEAVAIIVSAYNLDEAGKSNLIAGSGYAWDAALKMVNMTRDDNEASLVIDRVIVILCRTRGVTIGPGVTNVADLVASTQSTGTIPTDKASDYDNIQAWGYQIATEHPCPARNDADGNPWPNRATCGAATIAPKDDEIGYFCPTCGMTSA